MTTRLWQERYGQLILAEGPGKGFASYPWVLDKYERVLDLSPSEAWLLKLLIKYAWTSNQPVYPSMRKITKTSKISRTTLGKLLNSLIDKKYLSLVSNGEGGDRRKRYSVEGAFEALRVCILSDYTSKFRKNDPAFQHVLQGQEIKDTYGFKLNEHLFTALVIGEFRDEPDMSDSEDIDDSSIDVDEPRIIDDQLDHAGIDM